MASEVCALIVFKSGGSIISGSRSSSPCSRAPLSTLGFCHNVQRTLYGPVACTADAPTHVSSRVDSSSPNLRLTRQSSKHRVVDMVHLPPLSPLRPPVLMTTLINRRAARRQRRLELARSRALVPVQNKTVVRPIVPLPKPRRPATSPSGIAYVRRPGKIYRGLLRRCELVPTELRCTYTGGHLQWQCFLPAIKSHPLGKEQPFQQLCTVHYVSAYRCEAEIGCPLVALSFPH